MRSSGGASCALGLGVLGLATLACSRGAPPGAEADKAAAPELAVAPARAAPRQVESLLPAEEKTWSFQDAALGRMSAVALVPKRKAGERFPVLIAMHGLGEAQKGPERGARGWIDDYGLGRAIERLHAPPLTAEDFMGFVEPARLERLNRALSAEPFSGLIVVCPYTPAVLRGDRPFDKAPPLARFLVDELLSRVYRETPALGTPETTGIDGVSLGGRAALTVGLLRAEAFAAVGALQAAFDVEDAPEIAERVRRARQRRPSLELRLLSSDGDYFLRANRAIDRALGAAGQRRELVVVPGPHDYDFNRGPGAIEMLVYHDRVLRGRSAL
jgi:enterochelin esterase-like enzyme